jgi:hypothetical protein
MAVMAPVSKAHQHPNVGIHSIDGADLAFRPSRGS